MQVLPQAPVALRSLDGGVSEADLDLLERRPALVGEFSDGAAQVVGGDLAEAGEVGASDDGLEDGLRRDRPEAAESDRSSRCER